MVFSSLVFVFGFLPLFLAMYWASPGVRGRNLTLTLASYVFYGWWRPDFVVLMLISTLVDYGCGLRMAASGPRGRRAWLLLSLATNLSLLGWFRYANLLVETLQAVGAGPLRWEDVVLPVGISFYTFQTLSYTIDVYRGVVRPQRNLVDFACYVSMFPQLVAGPIVRYRDMEGQLTRRSAGMTWLSMGCYLFMIGMVKKVLVADNAALVVAPVFADSAPGLTDAWLGSLAYTIQILFDFSGYSDMAVGLGLMLGFRLPLNFNAPYRATSVTDFWRRWHISLSTWLRDYLYVPLGGNRRGPTRTAIHLMLTMLLGGLWHGAAWTFLLWGAYHGTFLALERARGRRALWSGLPTPLQVLATLLVWQVSMAIFNAEGLDGLAAIGGGLAGWHGPGAVPVVPERAPLAWLAVGTGLVLAWAAPHAWTLARRFRSHEVALVAILFLVALAQLAARSHTPFLYFQF